MTEAFVFWLAKSVAEFSVGVVVFFVGAVVVIGLSLSAVFRQARCRHESVRETQACDAICQHCGKNLGFIGTWRKDHP